MRGGLSGGERCDLHLKAAASHTQSLHARGDVLGERAAGRGTACGELSGQRPVALERGGLLLAQRGQVRFRAFHVDQLGFELGRPLEQLRGRHAMLSGQLFDRGQAPLHVVLSCGIHVKAF